MDVLKRAGETAGDTASTLFQGLQDVAEQTQRGFNKTKDDIDVPEWLQKILRLDGQSQSEGGDSSGGDGKAPKESRATGGAAAAATGAAFGYDQSDEDDAR